MREQDDRYSRRNVEVQVALLRNGLFKKDLAKLLGVPNNSAFSQLFRIELPQEIQELMIHTINLVGSGKEPTQKDLFKYKQLMNYVHGVNEKKRQEIDERTIAFVELIERENSYKIKHKEREIDAMCDSFSVNEEMKK